MLACPLRLRSGRNDQAVKRAEEAVDVADVRFSFQGDVGNGGHLQLRRGLHPERRVRIQFAVKITRRTKEPVAEFLFQPEGVGALKISGALAHTLRQRTESDVGAAGIEFVKL